MSILMFMCLDSGRYTTWLCRTYGMRLFCRWDVPVSIAAVSFVYLWKKIQWIVCIIAILTNKCLWFTIISNIKWKKHFVWFFSFFIFSCLFKVFHVGFEFCSKAKYFFFVHLLSCLVQLSSHILFEVCASYLRFHLLRLIFVLIYRNFYNGGKNQYAQYSKSFFCF